MICPQCGSDLEPDYRGTLGCPICDYLEEEPEPEQDREE